MPRAGRTANAYTVRPAPSLAPVEPTATRTIYSVSELVETLRTLVESALPRVWVQGEISNLSRPASGHWYFTLKDAGAQLRCAMFRNANLLVRPPPKDGDQVLIRGQLAVYAARGDLQLICEHLEPAGEGELLRAFEALKKRLDAEGLFDASIKRPLPTLPRAIGVITSATGAALQDILSTLARRCALIPVVVLPVPVQGADAAPAIVRALATLPAREDVDVIVLARGGGSLEDLWAFNEEAVARAIRACAVPVVCGVGHETDVTIADFAADLRAPTPTGAAERVAPDLGQVLETLARQTQQLDHAQTARLRSADQRLAALAQRLQAQHPQRRILERAQRIDELSLRLRRAQQAQLQRQRQHWQACQLHLSANSPQAALNKAKARLDLAEVATTRAMETRLHAAATRLARQHALLEGLNPHAVLQRGYAIALDPQGCALTDARHTQPGALLKIVLAQGTLSTQVQSTDPAG